MKRKVNILSVFLLLSTCLIAQQSATTPKKFFNIQKVVIPAILQVVDGSVVFEDADGNEVELDIIELCGIYSEYNSPEDAYKDLYGEKQLNELKDDIKDSWLEYREENDKEMTDESLQSLIDKDIEEKILDELNDDYCCRELSNGNVLIQE